MYSTLDDNTHNFNGKLLLVCFFVYEGQTICTAIWKWGQVIKEYTVAKVTYLYNAMKNSKHADRIALTLLDASDTLHTLDHPNATAYFKNPHH